MKLSKTVLLIPILFLSTSILCAQRIHVEKDPLYGSKINVPVKIEVQKKQLDYVFFATNKSYYPYTVHLKISQIVNLTPPSVDKWIKVNPGRSRLLELKTQDGARRSDYYYEYTYSIGVKGGKVDPEFPYLIPVKSSFDLVESQDADNAFMADVFKLTKGDTIFAARRGKIVATPDLYDMTDRISENSSIEILHPDATIMIYENTDPENVLLKAGKDVYPGQAIGLVNDASSLKLILYRSSGNGYLDELPIHYYLDNEKIEPFSEKMKTINVAYPMEIITKEFRRRELKNLEKGSLVL